MRFLVDGVEGAYSDTFITANSWFFDQPSLGYYPPPADWYYSVPTPIGLAAEGARELIVYSTDGLILDPRLYPPPTTYASVVAGNVGSFPTMRMRWDVPFMVNSAQLADHGFCRFYIPWGTVFPNLSSQIKKQVTAVGGVSIQGFGLYCDPFIRESLGHAPHIGFKMIANVELDIDTGTILGHAKVAIQIVAEYSVAISRNLPAISNDWAVVHAWGNGLARRGKYLTFLQIFLMAALPDLGFKRNLERGAQHILPALVNQQLVTNLAYHIRAGLTGMTCDPTPIDGSGFGLSEGYMTLGDTSCASRTVPAYRSERTTWVREYFAELAYPGLRRRFSAEDAGSIANALVTSLDDTNFKCVPRADIDLYASDPTDVGECVWHPTYLRVNNLPDRVEFVATEFDQRMATPEIMFIDAVTRGDPASLDVKFMNGIGPACGASIKDAGPDLVASYTEEFGWFDDDLEEM
jgi:hypothetical protein